MLGAIGASDGDGGRWIPTVLRSRLRLAMVSGTLRRRCAADVGKANGPCRVSWQTLESGAESILGDDPDWRGRGSASSLGRPQAGATSISGEAADPRH